MKITKEYVKPELETVLLQLEQPILSGSGTETSSGESEIENLDNFNWN